MKTISRLAGRTPARLTGLCMSMLLLSAGAYGDNTTYGTGAGDSLTSSAEGNTLIGANAGTAITYADYNTLIGTQAGEAFYSGSDSVLIGYQAGQYSYNGFDNTLLGYQSGLLTSQSGTSANDNSFFGYQAGVANTGGNDNTFFGYKAGYAHTTGDDNIYFGYYSGYGTSTADDNTAIGDYAFAYPNGDQTGYGNSVLGYGTGEDLRAGIYNTFIGFNIDDNGDGNFNTFAGYQAGQNSEHADYVTAIGVEAGWDNNRTNNTNDANRNTYFGSSAGYTNREGEDNLMVGMYANVSNTAVSRLVLIGASTSTNKSEVVVVGGDASATASGGIAFGVASEADHTDAVSIGYNTDSRAANTVLLGDDTTLNWDPNIDGQVSVGSSSYRFTNVYSQAINLAGADAGEATWTLSADAATDAGDSWQIAVADGGELALRNDISGAQQDAFLLSADGDLTVVGELFLNSDARLKTDIQSLANSQPDLLARTGLIQAVRYHYTDEADTDPRHLGVLAQQLEMLFPELVSTAEDGHKSVNYVALVPVLVEAVKDLAQQNQTRQTQLAALQARKTRLQALLAAQQTEDAQ